jgi:hypothetical protein
MKLPTARLHREARIAWAEQQVDPLAKTCAETSAPCRQGVERRTP